MSNSDAIDKPSSGASSFADKRRINETPFLLMPLDPSSVVDGVVMNEGYFAHDFAVAGDMREICPECKTTHLQLVLLQKGVKRAHMVCEKCLRCFDACTADGHSALL